MLNVADLTVLTFIFKSGTTISISIEKARLQELQNAIIAHKEERPKTTLQINSARKAVLNVYLDDLIGFHTNDDRMVLDVYDIVVKSNNEWRNHE